MFAPTARQRAAARAAAAASSAGEYRDLQLPTLLVIDRAELKIDKNPVGGGTFGIVYHAMYEGVEVAVKKLRPELGRQLLLENWKREVSFLHSMGYCANVVQILGAWSDMENDEYLIVTEWLAGGSLRCFLSKAGRSLSLCRRLEMCIQAAMGIRHLHKLGWLHRDIKSPNFLVDEHGKVKVCMCALANRTASRVHVCVHVWLRRFHHLYGSFCLLILYV